MVGFFQHDGRTALRAFLLCCKAHVSPVFPRIGCKIQNREDFPSYSSHRPLGPVFPRPDDRTLGRTWRLAVGSFHNRCIDQKPIADVRKGGKTWPLSLSDVHSRGI